MIQPKDGQLGTRERVGAPAPNEQEARALLADTAQAVKVMKASWLRVAMNLQRIRAHELWRLSSQPCSSFDEYVYGVLDIHRGVARRMLEAVNFTEGRRPELLRDYQDGRDVHVPSYDTLNQLRIAEKSFEGREETFQELENRVFEEGLGKDRLKKALREQLNPEGQASGSGASPIEPGAEPGDEAAPAVQSPPLAAEGLAGIISRLRAVETLFLEVAVPGEARRLLFELVELLEKEARLESAREASGEGITSEDAAGEGDEAGARDGDSGGASEGGSRSSEAASSGGA